MEISEEYFKGNTVLYTSIRKEEMTINEVSTQFEKEEKIEEIK